MSSADTDQWNFCGDPFWDDFRPIENSTTIPVPTECFAHTVLVAVPCMFFWFLVPLLILQMKRSRAHSLPWTTLQSMKWLVTTAILADKFFLLLLALWEKLFGHENVPIIDYVYPIVMCVTLIAMLVMKNECRRNGIHSSGVIFCTWLLFVVFGTPEFYAWITIGSDPQLVDKADFFRYLAYLVYYPLLLIQLFLHCFADPLTIFDNTEDKCPEERASFLNRQTMYWFSKIVSVGSKKPLEVSDLFDLDSGLKADYLSDQWKHEWKAAMIAYEARKQKYSFEHRDDGSEPLLGRNTKNYGATEEPKLEKETVKLPSIISCLWTIFKWDLLGATAVKFCCDWLQYANPLFLNLLITFTEDATAPWYMGLFYAIGLFLAAEIRSLFMSNYLSGMIRVGTGIQSVLTTAVYDKTLHLSNAARRQKTQGEIVNLMAIDVDRFRMIAPQLQQYWSSPMQIIICLFLLYQTIGYSVIAGLIIMLVIIPVNFKVSTISKKWMIAQMKLKDDRIRLSNEVLGGIKVVKLYAWEPPLEAAIDEIRQKEMSLIKKAAIVKTFADLLNIAAPFFVALGSFSLYTLTSPDHTLTPQVAFVSITLFNQMRGPLLMAADLVQQTVQCIVSNKRLKEYLVAEELDDESIDRQPKADYYEKTVDVDGATLTWERGTPCQLNNIQLKVDRGELLAVVGRVAAGKSSLLMSLLGEMDKLRGYIGVRGMCAFVPQQPWIQNRTLRDNILMGLPYNKVIYDEIIEACALKSDLETLPNGDMTEIGEKGINLSGGQKARVSLARAVYQDRDVYLLDDPLSAVDAHVARHIFEKVIGPNGLLAKKTRLLVTHLLSFLKDCDKVAVMRDGTITHIDTYDELLENEETAEILKEADLQKSEDRTPSDSSVSTEPVADDELEVDLDGDAKSQVSKVSKRSRVSRKSTKAALLPPESKKLIEKETAETGRVKFKVYIQYFRAMGIFMYFIPFLVTLTLNSLFTMSRSLWLTDWSNDNVVGMDPTKVLPLSVRLGGFALLGFLEVTFLYLSMVTLILGGVAASLKLHRPLIHNILRSPLSHFDVTPLGRILNRIGKDMELIDLRLSSNFRFLAISFVNVIQTCIIISISTPLFIAVIIPIFIIYLLILRYFIDSSRQLQRLASLHRSPIYSHFGETVQGAATIRAFNWVNMFKRQNKEKLEAYVRCSYFSMMSARWLAIRLEILGNTVILATALLAVWSKYSGTMSPGLIGLAVSYSLSITFMLNMFVRQVSEVETNVVSVERVIEYTNTPNEADWRSIRTVPIGWPGKGRLVIKDYSTRYRPGLELVLRGLSLNIAPGEKVGVVGRTGAGKSSLALALFRIVEAAEGKIILDDVDISSIGLHDLREKLTIIPQDPVLFSGSLRFNLDPTGEYDDADLWTALDHANLRPFVEGLPRGLDHDIDESGENISVGQRQLVCLTRALLRKSRVLVLDEATAAIDQQTDALIQATIRKEFSNSTVITIAHRLNTIMDYDKVLVMDLGKAVEFDTPQNLLNNKRSIFYSMAESAKLV